MVVARDSALGGGGLRRLLLQALTQRAVGLCANHPVELTPIARNEADSLDDHVVDAPPSVQDVQAVVQRDLGTVSSDHLRAHGRRAAAFDRFAEEGDSLAAGGLD